MPLYKYDVFVSVTGGIKVDDTGADLAILAAMWSSYKEKPLSFSAYQSVSLSGKQKINICLMRSNRVSGKIWGVVIEEIKIKKALNKLHSNFLPYKYDLNIYRGCSHRCQYCYALYSHRYLENNDFFIQIFREHHYYLVVYKRKKSKKFKITKLYFHYRFLGKYENYIGLRNSKKINLWEVFVRDIFPFLKSDGGHSDKTLSEACSQLQVLGNLLGVVGTNLNAPAIYNTTIDIAISCTDNRRNFTTSFNPLAITTLIVAIYSQVQADQYGSIHTNIILGSTLCHHIGRSQTTFRPTAGRSCIILSYEVAVATAKGLVPISFCWNIIQIDDTP
jgi:hypothetical protein